MIKMTMKLKLSMSIWILGVTSITSACVSFLVISRPHPRPSELATALILYVNPIRSIVVFERKSGLGHRWVDRVIAPFQ